MDFTSIKNSSDKENVFAVISNTIAVDPHWLEGMFYSFADDLDMTSENSTFAINTDSILSKTMQYICIQNQLDLTLYASKEEMIQSATFVLILNQGESTEFDDLVDTLRKSGKSYCMCKR